MECFRPLDDCNVLARGVTADVFPWGEGRVLKLLHRHFPASRAEREFEITRAVHESGILVPAAFNVIEVDGRYGIILERVEGPTLFRLGQDRPWLMFRIARQLAELHARIHDHIAPSSLRIQHDDLDRPVEHERGFIKPERQSVAGQRMELPMGEALCHGDFHPGNVIISQHGPVIIDWDTASRGDPLGDVARTLTLFQSARPPASTPVHIRLLIAAARGLICKTYLRRYLQLRPAPKEAIEEWMISQQTSSSGEMI
jgi:aminoglycoside phosphotransferase (APT) family kinase protein